MSREKLERAKVRNSPCESSIEPVLQKNNIQRQAYHGGAFVGNQVHKALKGKFITALTSALAEVVSKCCPELLRDAQEIAERYKRLMSQYSACSTMFSSIDAFDDEMIIRLDGHIKTFMATARREVVRRRLGNVTPKLHLLEDHIVLCIRRFGVGLGLLGEQGGEGLRHEMNIS